MTRNEAHDRADEIWGDSILFIHVDGEGAAKIDADPRMARKRIGARCSQFATHMLDANGHAVCHTECAKYEGAMKRRVVTFDTSKEESDLLMGIARRVALVAHRAKVDYDFQTAVMDLTAVHYRPGDGRVGRVLRAALRGAGACVMLAARFAHSREERHFKALSDVSGILWRVYSPDVPDDAIAEDFDVEGHRVTSAYDCTGRPFSYPARVRRTSTRTLVTQWTGIDV